MPVLRAQLGLNRGEPVKAIEQVQISGHYELGLAAQCHQRLLRGHVSGLHAGRGLPRWAPRRGRAAEFERILDHRELVVGDPVAALAHLQLARAWAISGDKAEARAAYENFLALWKDAHPDISILKQTRAEYAKLQ